LSVDVTARRTARAAVVSRRIDGVTAGVVVLGAVAALIARPAPMVPGPAAEAFDETPPLPT
jgi:hypothetical protein